MGKRLLKICIVLIFLFCIGNAFGLDTAEKSVINAIKNGDVRLFKTLTDKNPDKNCVFSNGKSGLYYAIKFNEEKIAWLILNKGANPNLIVGKFSTLVWAIRFDRRRIIRLLIEFGADVNYKDKNGNTPLILVSKLNKGKLCKILIDRGANPLLTNNANYLASDYVAYPDLQKIGDYLALMEEKYNSQVSLPSMNDGPYIYWETEEQIVLSYYERIQEKNLSRLIEKTIYVGEKDTIVQGLGSDKNFYHIIHKYHPSPYKVNSVDDIFAVGDVHGRFDALINLLINNKIIDADQNWIFGKGQLIFLGDLFDRGSMVTETLWFLHELKFKAEDYGGDVLVLLGNHEVMSLTGDHRYLNDKYDYFTKFTYTNYFEMYGKNSIIGRWLRNQNIAIQINDYLFLHAGISPQFDAKRYSFDTINSTFRNYLNSNLPLLEKSMEADILSPFGPLWFRGYAFSEKKDVTVPQQFVNNYLESRQLKKMILGHNMQLAITTSFEGKIVSIDVYINENGESIQGLLISGDKIFKCASDGTKRRLE